MENKDCLTKTTEEGEIYLVFDTEYIYSCSLGRHFLCFEKNSRFPTSTMRRKYGKNCRELHVYLQGVLGLTMKKEWQHFLEWLEGEAESISLCASHINCINRTCFLEKKFSINYPMGLENE